MKPALPSARIEAVYIEHGGWLTSWLTSRLRSRPDAEDVTQDLFQRLLLRPNPAVIDRPRAFLATGASRLVIDRHRRARIERLYLDSLKVLEPDAAEPSPEASLLAVERLVAIAAALDGLPDRTRAAFLLSRLEGLDHGQIAARLKVSRSRVKQYVATALAHCYLALGDAA